MGESSQAEKRKKRKGDGVPRVARTPADGVRGSRTRRRCALRATARTDAP
ncbi:hypothetical protein PV682_13725 [Streptomyces niveiscabiei]|nr:hypothetical protein [Streptomyces niveiscabiei]MDX3382515.1 hypothetical protein [Streptomyces niveiscabiei]